jgi:hypothetical protein
MNTTLNIPVYSNIRTSIYYGADQNISPQYGEVIISVTPITEATLTGSQYGTTTATNVYKFLVLFGIPTTNDYFVKQRLETDEFTIRSYQNNIENLNKDLEIAKKIPLIAEAEFEKLKDDAKETFISLCEERLKVAKYQRFIERLSLQEEYEKLIAELEITEEIKNSTEMIDPF